MFFTKVHPSAPEIQNLTNTRSSGADEALKLVPIKELSLEQAIEYIDTDERLEGTPKSIRIRKKILDPLLRKRSNIARQQKAQAEAKK